MPVASPKEASADRSRSSTGPARGGLGLRVQLLLALGVLTLASFVPLYLAVANLTRVTLRAVREDSAHVLGRAVAGRLLETAQTDADGRAVADVAAVSIERLAPVGDVNARGEGVIAIRAVRSRRALVELGAPAALTELRALGESAASGERTVTRTAGALGPILEVEVQSGATRVQVALRIGDQATRAAPLLRLVAFYTAGFAIVLLGLAAALLTRMIVRPLGGLVEATRDVEHGTRRRIDPRALVATEATREIAELGAAIDRATARLVDREEALAAKVAQLEAARAELLSARDAMVRSERLASVGRLAAGLAHEVGNPIAALLGLQDVLAMGELDEESRDLVTRMKRETERVHKIIRDLLDFSRAEQAPTSTETSARCKLDEVVAETLALLRPQKSFRDIELRIEIQPGLAELRIAQGRLQQVLLNLLLNAADALETRRVSAADDRIGAVSLVAHADGDQVELVVEDDGPGVPPSIRDALFEPFVTSKDVGKGTGLGLAVCRGLVEAAGGTIVLADKTGPGARFVLRLPTVDAPAKPRAGSLRPPPSLADA